MKNEVYGYIYMVKNKHNGKSYIGQIIAKKGKDRFLEHYRQAHYGYYPVTKFRNALRKYKIEDFEVFTIDEAYDKLELSEKEKFYILKYDTFKNGYNSSLGGDGGCEGYKHTKEAKEKISLNNSSRVVTESTKKKMSEAKLGKRNLSKSKKINMFHIDGYFLKTFNSILECANFIGVPYLESNIRRVLDGRQKRIKVFTFELYKDGYIQSLSDIEIKKMSECETEHSKKVNLVGVNNITGERIFFNTIKEAAYHFNVTDSSFGNGIKRSPDTYKNHRWSRQIKA